MPMADVTNEGAPHMSPHTQRATGFCAAAAPADAAAVVECTRSAGCKCPLCDMSAASMGITCTRSAGCACSECDMSLAALGGIEAAGVASSAAPGTAANAAVYTFAALNFNDQRKPGDPYDVEKDGKLGSVYTMLAEVLAQRGDWARVKGSRKTVGGNDGKTSEDLQLPRKFQLLLGTAQGKGIKFAQLGYGMWPPPLVNYYRGFNCLCRKAPLIQLLREAAGQPETKDILSTMPETFLFYPSHSDTAELNEHEPLAAGACTSAAIILHLRAS